MKGLLLKDYYTLIKQMRIYLVMIAIFAAIPDGSLRSFAAVYAAMLPITALAYDERSHWDNLAAMMPYSVKELVLSKYVLGYLSVAAASVLTALISLVRGQSGAEDLLNIWIVGCAAALFLAINLPVMFRMGVEKGRVVYLILMGALGALTVVFSKQLEQTGALKAVSPAAVLLVVSAVAVLANVLSVRLSITLYRRRRE